ncbi:type III-A CRISPR-associated protein Cas10/Csm1 [Clostridium thermosuccinogenes]|uniref:type III-A CRISPR-associated protein Cas10/Csm1 n=1 Tax=Clostridium thermosuccinogenes TaxID=84032 RepID=UPI00137477EF|nr:type III-A CRISPR-associated protein Cas10/Csm1 [Pseudoclostridium thermosuccinogenes]
MNKAAYITTVGGLLHDFGKVLHRSGAADGRSHSISGADYIKGFTSDKDIIDCIRFHHRKEIDSALLSDESPAYIVYIADHISSGADRKGIEGEANTGYDQERMLESVYNLLSNRKGKAVYAPGMIKNTINYPGEGIKAAATEYPRLLSGFTDGLSDICFEPEYINSLLELCEKYLSYIPASTDSGQVCDISLFDHSKITAALASCIALYLEEGNRLNYRKELYERESDFCSEKAFCLFSVDISGIQKFIYTISSKGALKGLRSRSFYLEILLENIADEILNACGVSRSNLLYTGGGHAYLLLPNTGKVLTTVKESFSNINRRLLEKFETELYIAYGIKACSANELMSRTGNPESYVNLFRSVSSQISAMKLRRYSAEDIRFLNSVGIDREGRECAVCGTSSVRLSERNGSIMCGMCSSLSDISGGLIKENVVFAVLREEPNNACLPVFSADGSSLYLKPMTADAVREMLREAPEKVVRIYSKNAYSTGIPHSIKLWMGDYAAKSAEGALKTFSELAQDSQGINRIAVLRADVDNLGAAFVSGFMREKDPENKYKYMTISRTTTLSRSLSLFFKYHINYLMENPEFSLTDKEGKRNVVIVYSGGDDLFIVGAWDEVFSAAVDIRRAFNRYTDRALTLSAGLAVFDEKYPISLMAEETAELEERAKDNKYEGGSKNSVSLFGLESEKGQLTDKHTYNWDTFESKVIGEKYKAIKALYEAGGDYGNTYFYNILYFLRESENEKVNVARLAYLLARREPDKKAADKLKQAYSSFSANVYKWALAPEDRKQLITALIIFMCTLRDEKED